MKQQLIHMHDQKDALIRIGKRNAMTFIDEILLMLAIWGLGLLIAIS